MHTETETTLEIVAPSALEAQERASIDMQITTARKFPRSLSVVKKQMLEAACLDEETASACFYSLSRKGADGAKAITGPSVRLAEIAISAFGHIRAGARIVGNDGKVITAQGICHDLQNNVLVSMEVRRRITGRDGKTFSEDMQIVTGNAACAIAFRNAAFKVVPAALIKPVFDAARRTAVGDATTLATRRLKCVEAFAKMEVPKEKVLAKIGKKSIEDITLDDLELLIGLHNAIRDGDTTADETFAPPVDANKPAVDLTKEKAQRPARRAAEEPKQQEAPPANEPEPPKPEGDLDKLVQAVIDSGFQPGDLVASLVLAQMIPVACELKAIPAEVVAECLKDFDTILKIMERRKSKTAK